MADCWRQKWLESVSKSKKIKMFRFVFLTIFLTVVSACLANGDKQESNEPAVMVVESAAEYFKLNPHVKWVEFETETPKNRSMTQRHTLGIRIHGNSNRMRKYGKCMRIIFFDPKTGDRWRAFRTFQDRWSQPQDAQTTFRYPATGTASRITFVEVIVQRVS